MEVQRKMSNSFCPDHERSNEVSVNNLNGPVKLKKRHKKKKVITARNPNIINGNGTKDTSFLNGYGTLELNGIHINKKKMSKKKRKKLNSLLYLDPSANNNHASVEYPKENRDLNHNVIVRKKKKLNSIVMCDADISKNIDGVAAINENDLKNKKKKIKKRKCINGIEGETIPKFVPNKNLFNNNKVMLINCVTLGSNTEKNVSHCNGVNKVNNKKFKSVDQTAGSLVNVISYIDTLQGGKLSRKRRKQLRSKYSENEFCSSRNSSSTLLQNNHSPVKIISNEIMYNAANQKSAQNEMPQRAPNHHTAIHLKKQNYNSMGNMSLPIHEVRKNLVKFVLSNETSILVGETGCGKSTQVPQFLYTYGLHKEGLICVTQPRKIAAISLAKRVAEEMGTEVGATVGYAVRFDERISGQTKLKYVTDGMLLREALSDPLLLKYQWIILDEAHERTVNTDILFGIVKKAQRVRKLKGKKQLRIIIMSATMDVDRFVAYFENANAKVIEGRQHEINYSFVTSSQKDYNLMCLSLLLRLHETLPLKYGFLVFLTGQDEIELFVKQINKIHEDKLFSRLPGIEAHPLYAQLPDIEQAKVFKTHFQQKRKVVVSTNIAETSLTIPDISVVIDSCHFKTRFQNPQTGFEELKVEKVSMAQAFQRAGRAGRVGPGLYYSVLTKEEFETLRENPIPEILKSELSSTYVTLLGAGIQNVIKFDFFDRPPMKNIRMAEVDLRDLEVISGYGDNVLLSNLGLNIKYLPLKPQFGKILLHSAEMGCSEEILTIISLLSCESIYVNPCGKQEDAKFQRRRFQAIEGDHITLLNVYNAFKATTNSKAWCNKNYLNFRNLDYAANIRAQLNELCEKRHIPIVSCQVNKDPYKVKREPILKSLISGLFKNVARRHERGKYKCLITEQEVFIHPGSLLFGSGSEFVLFTSVTSTGKQYMNINSIIDPQWLKDVCPDYFKNVDLPIIQNAFSVVS